MRTRFLEAFSAHRHVMLALRLPLLLTFLFCETAWRVYLAPTDVTRYECYALTFWFGSSATHWLPAAQCAFLGISSSQPAFHLLPLEYPPLTLLLFSVPLLVPLPYYSLAFALCIMLIASFIYWLFIQFHSQRAAMRFLLYLILGASTLVQVRFDLLPAACMLMCLIAAERKRWNIAYSALALGVLLKLYPIVALPALFIAEQQANDGNAQWKPTLPQVLRWQWKHLILFSSLLVGVTGCFALLNLQEAIVSPVSYLLRRPTQIESLQSSLLWLAHYAGSSFQVVLSYGSLNTLSPLASPLSWIGTSACVLGCLFVFRLQWQQKVHLGQAMIALLCLLIISGKVFSPQYVIWLIPLVAYVGASRLWLYCWGAISFLTVCIFTFYYAPLTNPQTATQIIQSLPGFFVVVSIRNLAFLCITLAYLFNSFQASQDPSLLAQRELAKSIRL